MEDTGERLAVTRLAGSLPWVRDAVRVQKEPTEEALCHLSLDCSSQTPKAMHMLLALGHGGDSAGCSGCSVK